MRLPPRSAFAGVLAMQIGFACRPSSPPAWTMPPPVDAAAHAEAATAIEAGAALDAAPAPPPALFRRGINLSGAEFGACCPGTLGRDYSYPTDSDVDLFVARGFTHVRLPFRHERLQRALQTDLDAGEWERLEHVIVYATQKGLTVAIEPHNSARYNGVVLSETEIGDLWGRITRRIMERPYAAQVLFNLTNEPRDMSTETWLALAQAAIREIRHVGSSEKILVPGNGWTGAMHWTSSWYGRPNSEVMQQINDPNVAFDVHLYLDADGSGAGKDCVSENIGVERLAGFAAWLKTHGRRGYLGEIGAPNTPTCAKAVSNALTLIEAHPALWLGWVWWSAGSRWTSTYPLSLQPLALDAGAAGVLFADRAQLEWLRPFLREGSCR